MTSQSHGAPLEYPAVSRGQPDSYEFLKVHVPLLDKSIGLIEELSGRRVGRELGAEGALLSNHKLN